MFYELYARTETSARYAEIIFPLSFFTRPLLELRPALYDLIRRKEKK